MSVDLFFLCFRFYFFRNQSVMDVMIDSQAVPKIIEMIPSDHEVMQNEALFAITILSAARLSNIEKMLIDAKIGEKITRLINERKPKKEVIANTLTLIRQLCSSSKNFLIINLKCKILYK